MTADRALGLYTAVLLFAWAVIFAGQGVVW